MSDDEYERSNLKEEEKTIIARLEKKPKDPKFHEKVKPVYLKDLPKKQNLREEKIRELSPKYEHLVKLIKHARELLINLLKSNRGQVLEMRVMRR